MCIFALSNLLFYISHIFNIYIININLEFNFCWKTFRAPVLNKLAVIRMKMIARELVCSLLIKPARVHDNLKRQMTGVILMREAKGGGGKVVVEINAGRTAAAIFQPASRHFIH